MLLAVVDSLMAVGTSVSGNVCVWMSLASKRFCVMNDAALGNTALQGKLAVANAKLAYQHYLEAFSGPRWEYLVGKGARSLTMVIPYFGYSTMERATRSGEVVTAKTRARLISAIPPCDGGMRVFLFDLHTDGIEFYLDDRVLTRQIYGAPMIAASSSQVISS